jgi:hypothetical protein
MSTFVNALINQEARTENGMKARASTANALTDFFFKAGAMRKQNIIPTWTAARVENADLACRLALWLRDVRGGAGERKAFRDILYDLANTDGDRAHALMRRVPEIGRWDDLLVLINTPLWDQAVFMIKCALEDNNGLCAKWMPRKGNEAVVLRNALGWSPKYYRKRLVELTKVVETQMCAKDWDNINFNHVPSIAASRYKKAFNRHTEKYKEWATKLVSKDPEVAKEVKVNAGAIFPHDVIKQLFNVGWGLSSSVKDLSKAELDVITAQWEALPNYVGDANILPLVDVSGSMVVGVSGNTRALDVAVSLGLYLADKNKGKFKDTFLTFSSDPQLLHLNGNIVDKANQMNTSKWEMSTDLHKAMDKILKTAIDGNVPQEEMPNMLLILSDMQFNQCTRFDDSAMEMISRKYEAAGYNVPAIVFWNLNAKDNVPVKHDESGVALVSGFSPSILKGVLSADTDEFTPMGIMMKTIMSDRYDF